MKNLLRCFPILLILASCDEQKVESPEATKVIKEIPIPKDEPAPIPTVIKSPTPKNSFNKTFDTNLVSQYIRKIFQDKNGNLWFGTVGEGVIRYDRNTLTYFTTREGLSGDNIQGIQEDRSGNLWFGTTGGVSKYNGTKFINYGGAAGLKDSAVLSLLLDKYDNIWVGTYNGVYRYTENSFQGGKAGFVNFSALSVGEINNIMEDRAGNIWFATSNSGVYKFDGRRTQNYNAKDGLLDNHISCILEDRRGNIWFATKKGLSCYNIMTGYINYPVKEGLALNGAFRLYEDKQGNIWVASFRHIYKFDGISFKGYDEKDGINPTVQSIYQDKAGNLWFGAGSGLFLFRNEHFVSVTKKGPWPQ